MKKAMLETNPKKRAHLNHVWRFLLHGTGGDSLIAGDNRGDKQGCWVEYIVYKTSKRAQRTQSFFSALLW
jgi:hypothetical protein